MALAQTWQSPETRPQYVRARQIVRRRLCLGMKHMLLDSSIVLRSYSRCRESPEGEEGTPCQDCGIVCKLSCHYARNIRCQGQAA
jgi:hypothetical protein